MRMVSSGKRALLNLQLSRLSSITSKFYLSVFIIQINAMFGMEDEGREDLKNRYFMGKERRREVAKWFTPLYDFFGLEENNKVLDCSLFLFRLSFNQTK